MPTLNWIGKNAVVNTHQQVPYRLLHCHEERSVGDALNGNLLIEGDNLHALKALLPYYAGKVQCIYIDPPYNTGDENWVYNDAVNSPEMRAWLGEAVGRAGEDLSRHDKWLCMMYPRLSLLRELLKDTGVIFVSIDENEVGHLRLVMDEIFTPNNALGTLVWKRRSPSAMRSTPLSIDHEYVLVYAGNARAATLYGLIQSIDDYPYQDERGRYTSTDLTVGMDRHARPGQFYTITNPRTGAVYEPNPERVWRFFPDTMQKVIESDLIIWPDEQSDRKMQRPRYKTYYDPEKTKPKPVSSWIETANANDRELAEEEVEYGEAILSSGMNQEGGRLLQQIFGSKSFAYPKPLSLIRSLIRATTRKNDLILDSFAGTGTTGHAVLDLNQEDGGNRRFVLVEMESAIARNITAERLRRVIKGYTRTDGRGKEHSIAGLGGSFRFCTLDEPLFDERGRVRWGVTFGELARHIFFTETGRPLPAAPEGEAPFIGEHDGVAYYLLWSGTTAGVLDAAALRGLAKREGPKVVYAELCRVSPLRLEKAGITYKQMPYNIRTS